MASLNHSTICVPSSTISLICTINQYRGTYFKTGSALWSFRKTFHFYDIEPDYYQYLTYLFLHKFILFLFFSLLFLDESLYLSLDSFFLANFHFFMFNFVVSKIFFFLRVSILHFCFLSDIFFFSLSFFYQLVVRPLIK